MAAITGAVIAAGTAVSSAASQRSAAKRAGRSQTQAADAALAEQRRQFDLTREDFAGFRERGGLAGEREAEFLGLRGVEAEREALAGFTESPGQAFLRERGLRAANRAASVSGELGGGNILEELLQRGTGFAQQFLGERLDRLSGVAGRGLGATTSGAQIGAGISGRISQGLIGAGEAQATDILRRQQTRESGLRRIAGAFTGSGGIFGLGTPTTVPPVTKGGGGFPSDRRLKRNIRRIGTRNGYAWYTFDFIWGEASEGVMSDEVPAEFVSQIQGFDVVDYGRIL